MGPVDFEKSAGGSSSGRLLFRKGDPADEMFLVGKGKYLELDQELQPGQIFGELGLLTPGYHRTQTVVCVESGHVLTLPYDEVRALYFENPEFGFYFLQLASGRLLRNKARAEDMLTAERRECCECALISAWRKTRHDQQARRFVASVKFS
jgi:CRP/FNR family transcriptional regulator, cyclic AMP receptor protein